MCVAIRAECVFQGGAVTVCDSSLLTCGARGEGVRGFDGCMSLPDVGSVRAVVLRPTLPVEHFAEGGTP